jgi:hypothetical protein
MLGNERFKHGHKLLVVLVQELAVDLDTQYLARAATQYFDYEMSLPLAGGSEDPLEPLS